MKPRLVVMASGQGSVFSAIAEACQSGQLNAELVGLICSRDGIGAVDRAQSLGIPCVVVDLRAFKDRSAWDKTMTETVKRLDPSLIALAGYTQLIGEKFLKTFAGKVVNTHPSLLPKFGGKGMYGKKVYEAVLSAGETETGITVHQVTGEYDTGPVVAQERIPVKTGDTVETLSERVRAIEKNFYLQVLGRLLDPT